MTLNNKGGVSHMTKCPKTPLVVCNCCHNNESGALALHLDGPSLILLFRMSVSLAMIVVEDMSRECPEFFMCSPTAVNEAVLVLLCSLSLVPN